MALIACLHCDKEISEFAPTCPSCRRPMEAPVTIQTTGWQWKGFQTLGVVLLIVGLIILFSSFSFGSIVFGILITSGGLVAYLYGFAGALWHHA
jgi:uncharacterized membrane protein HdeD (DUF308 family)